jgi:hypothetical protein
MVTQASGYTTPLAHTERPGESGGTIVQSNLIIGRERGEQSAKRGGIRGVTPAALERECPRFAPRLSALTWVHNTLRPLLILHVMSTEAAASAAECRDLHFPCEDPAGSPSTSRFAALSAFQPEGASP